MFMDLLAPNLEDTIFRSLVMFVIFIVTALIAYKGKKHLSNLNPKI